MSFIGWNFLQLLSILLLLQDDIQISALNIDHSASWVKRLYSFTIETTEILLGQDDASKEISGLPLPLPYCTDITTALFVCTNGIVSFNKNHCPYAPGSFGTELIGTWPFVAPFHADLTFVFANQNEATNPILFSGLFLRGVTKTDVIDRATADVRKFKSINFYAIWVHVSTWYKAKAWGLDEFVTFQLAIITDGLRSFARISYGEMTWQSESKKAQVGYKFPSVGRKCTGTLNVSLTGHGDYKYPLDKITGNIGEVGVWMYELTADSAPVQDVNYLDVKLKPFSAINVNLGESLNLLCSLSSFTNAQYIWFRDGVQFENDNKPFFIVNTRAKDSGLYKCGVTLSGKIQMSRNSLDIKVKYLDQPYLAILPQPNVEINSTVFLTCNVNAFPPPAFTWYKNGKVLQHFKTQLATFQFVSKDDSGIYQCVAQNLIGEKFSSTLSLHIWDVGTPTVSTTHEGLTPQESRVVMTCIPSGNASPELVWLDEKRNIVSNGPVFSIEGVSTQMSGTYVCQARRNTTLKYSRPISLLVTYFNEPSIHASPSNIILENTKVTLNCSVDTLPAVTSYSWSFKGKVIKTSSDSTHVVQSMKKENAGMYSCIVNQVLGKKEAQLNVDVQYIRKPVLTASPNNSLLKEGSNMVQVCSVDSIPAPTFIWYYNNARLTNTLSYLAINNMTIANKGSYMCEATNVYGSVKSTEISFQISYLQTPVLTVSNPSPTEGSSLKILCAVEAYPAAKFVWEFESKEIGKRYKIGTLPTLERVEIDFKSSGRYWCIVENFYGKKQVSIDISVKYLRKPSIEIYPNSTITEGEDITMRCLVEGHPISRVAWLKGSVEKSSNTSLLNIQSVKRSDAAAYQCVVYGTDNLLQSSDPVTFNVLYVDKPLFRSSGVPTQGQSMTLTCDVQANPPVKVTQYLWKFNGKNIQNSGKDISLQDLNSSFSGVYECSVQHEAGFVSNISEISVNYLDVPVLKILSSALLIEGEHLQIKCVVKGTSPLSYSWYHNGVVLSGKTTQEIIFSNATLEKEGSYFCKVSNMVGERSSESKTVNLIDNSDPIIHTSSNTLHSGTPLTINCEGRNGGTVWLEHEGRFVSNQFPYNKNAVTKADSGYYVCKERSSHGTKISDATINIFFLNIPVLKRSPSDDLLRGESVVLSCIVEGTLPLEYLWFHNNVRVSGTGSSLILNKLSAQNDGGYRCVVSNVYGSKSSHSLNLDVHYLDQPIIFSSAPLQNITVYDYIKLTCNCRGNPAPSFTWIYNNNVISTSPDLEFFSVTRQDNGLYVCRVIGHSLVKEANVTLSVQHLEKPLLSIVPTNKPLERNAVIFTCSLPIILPDIQYMWYHGNHLLQRNSQTYEIRESDRRDTGNYSCVVKRNQEMLRSNLVSVIVQWLQDPVITIISQTVDGKSGLQTYILQCTAQGTPSVSYLWKLEGKTFSSSNVWVVTTTSFPKGGTYTFKCTANNGKEEKQADIKLDFYELSQPTILPLTRPHVAEGQSVFFKCSVNGTLPISYSLLLNGRKHAEEKRISGSDNIFAVHNISREDAKGIFSCGAKNVLMEKVSEGIKIDVSYLGDVIIRSSSPFTSVNENETVTLTCLSSASPEPMYTWIKRQKVLSRKNTITFLRITIEDAGEIECVVSNNANRITAVYNIIVNYVTKPTLSYSGQLHLLEGSSLRISCNAKSSIGFPIFHWFRTEVEIHDQQSGEFRLQSVNKADEGIYMCAIVTTSGSLAYSDKYLELKVIERPQGNTSIAVCGIFETYLDGRCNCLDGFYGDGCRFQSKSLQGEFIVKELCVNVSCYKEEKLMDALQGNNGFYLLIKGEIESQLLDALKKELIEPDDLFKLNVLRYKKFSNYITFDLMFYFTRESVMTPQQFNDLFMTTYQKYFVNFNKLVANSVIFSVVMTSAGISDFNHCNKSMSKCSANADCLTGKMMYHCRCKKGFVGDGFVCNDLNQVIKKAKANQNDSTYRDATYGLAALLIILIVGAILGLFIMTRKSENGTRAASEADINRVINRNDFNVPRSSVLKLTKSVEYNNVEGKPPTDSYDSDLNQTMPPNSKYNLTPNRSRKITSAAFQNESNS